MERDDIVLLVAANIQAVMHEKGMTPASLARGSGLNPTGIYDILSGKSRSPRLDTINKIAKGLSVPVSSLLEDPGARAARQELMAVFARLSPEERSRLIVTAEAWTQAGAA